MPLPSIFDVAHKHLFDDVDKLTAAGLPQPTINHLVRLRDVYSYWVQFPSKRDKDIVAVLRARYDIGETVARQDLRLIKALLGSIEKSSRDYILYRVTAMAMAAYEKAAATNNTRDMIAASNTLVKAYKLDKEDDQGNILDTIAPLKLDFTDDPTVIGIKRMKDFRNKIKALKERYWTEATQDIEFEEIDTNFDKLFHPESDGIAEP